VKTFQTTFGPVPVWGEIAGEKPLLFVIRGAFDELDAMTRLQEHAPDFDVALVHLPGMHTPYFDECSVHAFARAYDEILADLARPRTILLGLSTGALVAMAMRNAQAIVAVEPPLSPAAMWPLIPRVRSAARADADVARWVRGIFGVTQTGVEPIDYSPLLAVWAPGVVLLAGEPLEPPRPVGRLPSLVSPDARARIAQAPHLRTAVIPGTGHNIPAHAPDAVLWALCEVSR
jgi:pimeloyl-ACP methyl ester carboxylesterase